jgi:general secretion pathway protein D
VCVASLLVLGLAACSTSGIIPSDDSAVVDPVRNADLQAHFPIAADGPIAANGANRTSGLERPMLFPGSSMDPRAPNSNSVDPGTEVASNDPSMAMTAGGAEFNFEQADIQTVAKSVLGDTLHLNYIVDPRVQGTVTLESVGPVARKDVLPLFESALRMSDAAVVRDGSVVKIVPVSEAVGTEPISVGAGQPGFGVSIVPLRYTSVDTIAKIAESFLSRPGAIRADEARNVLLVQGTDAERQTVVNVVSTFDVNWLRNQSVGIYPLKSTQPETMIQELDRVFQANQGGQGQNVIRFQPISRMNAVMAVARTQQLLAQATVWIRRLDQIDSSGNTLRTYQVRYGNAEQVAKILNNLFVGHAGAGETAADQLAPGTTAGQSKLDSLDNNNPDQGGSNGSLQSASLSQDASGPVGASNGNSGNSPFGTLAHSSAPGKGNDTSALTNGDIGKSLFQNVRITADSANNSIIIYSNLEDFRSIEQAIHDIDKPQLQVAIDATVAEVTLTNALQYGVQNFLTSSQLHLGTDRGSVGLFPAAGAPVADPTTANPAQTVASAFLQRTLPGFNLLLGSEAQPSMILSALSTITSVKVLSSPSLVALDNQPALLEVGDEIPVTTSSATLLASSSTPVVNTIDMESTGVILKVLPHVHANGTVQLEIEQQISNVVNPDQQTLTPTISQRRIHTTVAVNSGQTVLLGGLISQEDDRTKAGIPGLNQIKFLGNLFGTTTKNKTRSEIIVFIRPQVIRDGVDAQDVTEEFRERLQSMHSQQPLGQGDNIIRSKY